MKHPLLYGVSSGSIIRALRTEISLVSYLTKIDVSYSIGNDFCNVIISFITLEADDGLNIILSFLFSVRKEEEKGIYL